MEELHQIVLQGRYMLREDISKDAQHLIRSLLEINPDKRISIHKVLQHPWFSDVDPSLKIFTPEESSFIARNYTARKSKVITEDQPADGFTEQQLQSLYSSNLKNCSSKSEILAPFNSTFSSGSMPDYLDTSLEFVDTFTFSRQCREINRQYELNNNGKLDNGVYHKDNVDNSFDSNEDNIKGLMVQQQRLDKNH